jgi:hypothetical protein
VTVQVEAMPKKKNTEPEAPAGQAAKVHLDVLKMARAIVGIRGGSVTQLVSDTCRPAFVRIIQEMQRSGEFLPKQED